MRLQFTSCTDGSMSSYKASQGVVPFSFVKRQTSGCGLPPVAHLCCAVLCGAVLCCAVLCGAVLCCAVLCCATICKYALGRVLT